MYNLGSGAQNIFKAGLRPIYSSRRAGGDEAPPGFERQQQEYSSSRGGRGGRGGRRGGRDGGGGGRGRSRGRGDPSAATNGYSGLVSNGSSAKAVTQQPSQWPPISGCGSDHVRPLNVSAIFCIALTLARGLCPAC